MDPLDLLQAISAGVCLYAGITHLLIGLRSSPRDWLNLSFALVSLLFGIFSAILFAQYYAFDTGSLDFYVFVDRWGIAITYLAYATLFWFLAMYTKARRGLVFWLLIGTYILISILCFILPYPWVYTDIMLTSAFPPDIVVAPWYSVEQVLTFLALTFYSGFNVLQQYRRGEKEQAQILGLALIVFLVTLLWDYGIEYGLIDTVLMAQYGFVAFIVLMSLNLSGRVVNAEKEVRRLNIGLEGLVDERTAELLTANQSLLKTNKDLQEAKEMAEIANRAKSVFLANMSHELRTPLNAILGFTQIVQRDRDFPPGQRSNLDIISESGEHLLDLINDILEMSKIEAGRITLNVDDFDLYYTLERLKSTLGMHAESKGLNLEFTQKDDVPRYIRTDEGKLRQVLLNVLGNAIKFTEVGSVRLSVSYESVESSRGTLKFSIEDTGVGIAPDEIDLVFEPFRQTESGQKSGKGTGLGLPISQQFVRLMSGEIHVESQFGKGSTFNFDIAVEVVEPVKPVAKELAKIVVGLAPNQPEYRILVVDDSRENRALLEQMLSKVGFEVRTVNDGQAAIDSFQSWQPDLIWMDIRMPGMDGIQVTQQIKDSDSRETIIIAVTASIFEEDRVRVLEAGCDDFVRKPFTEQEIFNMMAKHLGLVYVYDEPETHSKPHKSLSADDLAILPKAWIEKLNQAANRGRVQPLQDLISQIETEYPWIAESLLLLIDEYQFKQIVDLTEPEKNDGQ